jgi:hypothetical protein
VQRPNVHVLLRLLLRLLLPLLLLLLRPQLVAVAARPGHELLAVPSKG